MKRILIAMLAVVVACGFSGCKADERQTEIVSETTEISNSFNWQLNELTDNICINDIGFSLPCTLNEFNELFNGMLTVSNEETVTIDNSKECYTAEIIYNESSIGQIYYTKTDNEIFGLLIFENETENYSLSLGDIILNQSTKDEVFEKLGTPTRGEKTSDVYVYVFDNRKDITLFFNNNIVTSFTLSNISDYDKLK